MQNRIAHLLPDDSDAIDQLSQLASEARLQVEARRDWCKLEFEQARAELYEAHRRALIARDAYLQAIDQLTTLDQIEAHFPTK